MFLVSLLIFITENFLMNSSFVGFLLKVSCTENEANIFENLYHPNPKLRTAAVTHLVQNFEKINISPEGTDLLKDTVNERLNDDNPEVVLEVLKFNSEKLINLIGQKLLIQKLSKILVRCMKNPQKWQEVCVMTLRTFTSRPVWDCKDQNRVFLALIPFLFPVQKSEVSNVKLILDSDYAKSNQFLSTCKIAIAESDDPVKISAQVQELLEKKKGLPSSESLLTTIEDIFKYHKNINAINIYHDLLVLAHSLEPNVTVSFAQKILKLITVITKRFRPWSSKSDKPQQIASILRQNKLPSQLDSEVLKALLKSIKFEEEKKMNLARPSEETFLKLSIFRHLIGKFFDGQKIYNELIKIFLARLFDTDEEKILFLSEFCLGHALELRGGSFFQLRVLNILSHLLNGTKFSGALDDRVFLNSFLALTAESATIRACGVELMEGLAGQKIPGHWKFFLKSLLKHKEEFLMDEEQISLVFFSIISNKKGITVLEKSYITKVLGVILNLVQDKETHDYYTAQLLSLIKHVNDPEVCEVVSEVALRILQAAKGSKEIYKFNHYQSLILKLVILKLNKDTIKNISSNLWMMLQESLECHLIIWDPDGKCLTPSILAIELFEEDVFASLHTDYQMKFLTKVVKAATFSDHPTIISAANKLFKRIEIQGDYLKQELKKLFSVEVLDVEKNPKAQKEKNLLQQQSSILSTENWRCGVTLLELLQTRKKNVKNMHELIAILFQVLEKCLEFLEQARVEYTKQMILSLILQCCQKISPDGKSHRNLVPDSILKIDSVMKCIRETENPQTHHHALLLLCHLAIMIPDQVLHSMMTIFTFIGNSLVRHDDSYSFQIIMKIIENVIPTLIEENVQEKVVPVLRIFSDVLLDVPEHRRIPLYVKLLQTLGASDYLWVFSAILMESQVIHHEQEKKERAKSKKASDASDIPRRLQIGLTLATEFDSKIIVDCCSHLILYLKELPMTLDKASTEVNLEAADKTIFSVQTHNDFQLRHFKYLNLQFIDNLLGSMQVVNKIAALDEEAIQALKPSYQNLILQILTFIPEIKKTLDHPKIKGHEKSFKVMLQICFDVLQSAISLLTPDMLIVVVQNLVRYQYMNVRKKVLELLITKLELNYFDDCNPQNVLKLLDPLREICESTVREGESKVIPASATPQEIVATQQLALMALKLLTRKFAGENVKEFKEILDVLTGLVENHTIIKINVLANMIVCIADLIVELKVHAIGHLSKFMPILLKLLTVQIPDHSLNILLLCNVVSLLKVIETLPLFLSPYIVNIIVQLAKISPNLKICSTDSKLQTVLQKIQKVWSTMAQLVPSRVLIPAIDESYVKLIKKKNYKSVEPLMELMIQMFQHFQDFKAMQNQLSEFFLKALQFRCDQEVDDEEGVTVVFGDVNESEGFVIKTFVALILKLSESSFRPLYFSLYDWAIRNSDSRERIITFYRLSNEIAEALKSLFVLFASDVVVNAADILNQLNLAKVEKAENLFFPGDKEKNIYLIEHILKTLYNIFLHDRQNFINTHRFDTLMQPIVDQLENEMLLDNEDLRKLLMDCLAQLAVAASDDILWKQLNYQILLKARNNNSEIRILALQTCVEIARKLGEDFQPLIPETIPFLAELLEDENYKVEESCQKAIQELEKILGEPLQKYF